MAHMSQAAIGYDYRELEIFVHEEEDMAFMGLGDSPDLADTPSLCVGPNVCSGQSAYIETVFCSQFNSS